MSVLEIIGAFVLFFFIVGLALWRAGVLKFSVEIGKVDE